MGPKPEKVTGAGEPQASQLHGPRERAAGSCVRGAVWKRPKFGRKIGQLRQRAGGVAGLAIFLLIGPTLSGAAEPFDLQEIRSKGRTVAAELVDLDGDGRLDLFEVGFVGFPPNETRWIRTFRQRANGELPDSPDDELALPEEGAAYDLADVLPDAGTELILLGADGLLVMNLGSEAPVVRKLEIPGGTLLASADERGLDRLRIAWTGLGSETLLLVPGLRETLVLDASGSTVGRLQVGLRANYFVPQRTGPVAVESELQMFFDIPTLHVGDVNGDGRADVVAASRYELRIFLRRADDRLPAAPDRRIPLALVSERDHIRGAGAVRINVTDLNADGLLDLLISQVSGSLTDAETRTTVHLNRDGRWKLGDPDQRYTTSGAWTAEQLVDLDRDGKRDLVRISIPFTLLEVVEALVQRAIDAQIAVHRAGENGSFEVKPWIERKFSIPFSFDTGRPRGFVPTVEADLNADGFPDLLHSAAGDALEVFLGGAERRFANVDGRQEFDTQGRVRFGDLNADTLTDFVLYSPRRPGAPIIIGRNRGVLPGSPKLPPSMEKVGSGVSEDR